MRYLTLPCLAVIIAGPEGIRAFVIGVIISLAITVIIFLGSRFRNRPRLALIHGGASRDYDLPRAASSRRDAC